MSRFDSDEAYYAKAALRYVYLPEPVLTCPVCGGAKHKTTQTFYEDRIKCQRKKCHGCGHNFIRKFKAWEDTGD